MAFVWNNLKRSCSFWGARGRLLLPHGQHFLSFLSNPVADSPGIPPSAGAHQLFRGFSFVATGLMEDGKVKPAQPPLHSVVQVKKMGRRNNCAEAAVTLQSTPEGGCRTRVLFGAGLKESL